MEIPGMEDVLWLQWWLIRKTAWIGGQAHRVMRTNWSLRDLCVPCKMIQVRYMLAHQILIKFSQQPCEICTITLFLNMKEWSLKKLSNLFYLLQLLKSELKFSDVFHFLDTPYPFLPQSLCTCWSPCLQYYSALCMANLCHPLGLSLSAFLIDGFSICLIYNISTFSSH